MYKVENDEFDRNYREHYEAQDQLEIERMQEEAVQDETNEKMAQGEDDLTDIEKEEIMKKSKYHALIA